MTRYHPALAAATAVLATAAAASGLLLASLSPAAAAPAPAVLAINAGNGGGSGPFAADNPAAYVSGAATTSYTIVSGPITGTTRPALFTTQRYASSGGAFTYTLPLPAGAYTVTLHWAEVWSGAYAPGRRMFDVAVGGVTVETGLDIFVASGGARTALVRSYPAAVEGGGGLAVTFTSKVQNSFVSAIEVHRGSTTGGDDGAGSDNGAGGDDGTGSDDEAGSDDEEDTDDEGGPATEVEEKEPTAPAPSTLRLNVGGPAVAGYTPDTPYVTNGPATKVWTSAKEVSTAAPDAAPAAIYATQRWGKELAYTFPLPAGTYTLRLHFAELYSGAAFIGGRVFSITATGGGATVTLDKVDVFESAYWATASSRTLSVAVVGSGGLHLMLKSSVENAMLQGIEVMAAAGAPATPPVVTPVPPTPMTPTGTAAGAPPPTPDDHFAHAVIDPHPSAVVDIDGNGRQSVTLSAYDSHTHRFHDDGSSGELLSFIWTAMATGEELGSGISVVVEFPLGTTAVKLTVVDDGGNASDAESVVTVVGSLAPGAYCYYYAGNAGGEEKPIFAAVSEGLNFPTAASFPEGPQGRSGFKQRCLFLYKAPVDGAYAFDAAFASGEMELTVDGASVLAASAGGSSTASGQVWLAAGMHEAVTTYRHNSGGAAATVSVTATGSGPMPKGSMEWDRATVVPVVTGIEPASGGLSQGTRVTVTGVGFYTADTQVTFGGVSATAVVRDGSTRLTVEAPAAAAAGDVDVVVTTGGGVAGEGGVSGGLTYTYEAAAADPIKFTETSLKSANGGDYYIAGPTSIALGPDGRVYVGQYKEYIQALTVDPTTHVVTDSCVSESVGEKRSVLSLAFDPMADGDGLSLLAATSLLYYTQNHGRPLSEWDNGEVVVLRPSTGDNCLVVDQVLLSGLPVSNHDHAVQALEWDQEGRLLLVAGGQTNMGANVRGIRLGGVDETPLSAAVLRAAVHAPSFDGHVTYDQTADARMSRQTGGWGVAVHASGVRNSYAMVLHTNGELYGTDNGPNGGFGDVAIGCDASAAGFTQKDKLLRLSRGGYYGHPNRNRARDDGRQCTYHRNAEASRGGYTEPLADLGRSSINGVTEYMANLFGGALKHDLLLAKFSGRSSSGSTQRVQLAAGGAGVASITDLFGFSGLLMAQTPAGVVLAPQPQKNRVLVAAPDYPTPPAAAGPVVVGVGPHRGRAAGGNTVTIAGHHFGEGIPAATIGGAPCTDVRAVAVDGRSFQCTAPRGTPGSLVRVVVTTSEGRVSAMTAGRGDYWYMDK